MEKLKVLLNKVFDSDGNVLPCGREVCKELISTASQIYPNVNFGNVETGQMNIDNMLQLRSMF